MIHISYFLLLLFCISTNMMPGMNCSDMAQNVDWNSMEQNSNIPTQNRCCNSQQQPVAGHLSTSSPFARQFPSSTTIQNMDPDQQDFFFDFMDTRLDQQDCSFNIEEYLKPTKSLETATSFAKPS